MASTESTPGMKNKPPGWYRKATDRRQHGYWDGGAWVEPAVEEPEPEPEPSPPPVKS